MLRFVLRAHLNEHAGDLASINADVVGQLDGWLERKFLSNCVRHRFCRPRSESHRFVDIDLRTQQDGETKPFPGGRFPAITSLTATGGLLFGKENESLFGILRYFQNRIVGRAGPLEHNDFARSEEHTSELQSPDHLVCRLLLEKKKKTTSKFLLSNKKKKKKQVNIEN